MDTNNELTDKQILQSLLLKRDRLVAQIAKVDVAIAAFGDDVEVPAIQQGSFKIATSIRAISNSSKNKVPSEYDAQLSYPAKIFYIISNTPGGAFVDDIVEYISEAENISDRETLKHRITQTTSKLGREKKLKHEQVGRRYKYKLP